MGSILGTKNCYGCGVCAASCKKHAIRMIITPDGFYQPEVNENLCINCGVCVDVCSFQTEDIKQNGLFDAEYFAGWSHDKDVRHKCSSGGVGFEIARYLLEKDYVAIVCGYNSSERRAKHFLANTIDELKASVGSKYIQSNTYYAFSQLQSEKKYLVVGTPCQIDSIRRWVKRMKMDDSVILMDFFCHGVPSLLMWDKYLAKVEGKIGRIDNIVWRDKEAGWHDSWVMKVNGCYVSRFSQGDLFYRMFLKNRCLAKPCYDKCKFKGINSAADIRIGDLWGREYAKNEEGVSGVVGLTKKGASLLAEMSKVIHLEASSTEIVCESQMKSCAIRPLSYRYVMRNLRINKPLSEIDRNASFIEMFEEIPSTIKYYAFCLPVKIKDTVKKIIRDTVQ